jgi:hypothetical protein
MPRKIIVVALLSIGIAACSDDDTDDLGETAESALENLEESARSAASEVEEAVDEAATDAAELVVRNLAAEQGEQQFEDAGFPLDDQGLACEATVADGLDAVEVSCTGTTQDGGSAEMTGSTDELPGASVTELEGSFTGTVDGTEAFSTDTLGG